MRPDIEHIYAKLLDQKYQKNLFGDLPGFASRDDGYIASCPFHEGAEPTLLIHAERPEYFCFVCSARGDWLEYMQQIKKMDFNAALLELAGRSGITVRKEYTLENWKRDHLQTQLLEQAMTFCKTMLWSSKDNEALKFLTNRGYTKDEIEGMELGYNDGYDNLCEFLKQQGFTQYAVQAVLRDISPKYKILIPYRDTCGRIAGIAARDISNEGEAAYIFLCGESETRDIPFLMHKARGCETLVIVQGFLDALLADQAGVQGVVGIERCGLTKECLDSILSYHTTEILLAFNNDPSGKKAAIYAQTLLLDRGMRSTIIDLPGSYHDVDEYLRNACIMEFGRLIEAATHKNCP